MHDNYEGYQANKYAEDRNPTGCEFSDAIDDGDTKHPHLSTYVLGKYAAEMMDKINKKRQTQLQYCRLALSRT